MISRTRTVFSYLLASASLWILSAGAMEVTFHVRDQRVTRAEDRAFQNLPLSGWCVIADQAGRNYYPVEYNVPGQEQKGFFYFWENFRVDLKPGIPYKIRVEKGLGWNPFEETLTFEKNQTLATLNLTPWVTLGDRRWLAGDLESRFSYMDPSLAMDSQGINLVCRVAPSATATSEVEKRANGFNHLANERGFTGRDWGFGEFNVLGILEELVTENETSFTNTDLYYVQKGNDLAGHVDVVDPESPEVPVAAALGLLDTVRIVGPKAQRDEIWDETRVLARFEAYYELLNAGFRLPVSAASLSQENEPIESDRIGASRVYARVLGTFSLGGFLDLLKKGPSWATNGPAVSLMVNKKDPGTVFEIHPPRTGVQISMGARSNHTIDRLEFLHNGQVIDSIVGSATADHVVKDFFYEVTEPGWIAVRVFEKPREGEAGIRYAHSSPFYLTLPEKISYRKETIEKIATRITALIAGVEADQDIQPEEKKMTLDWYRKALDFYQTRLQNAEAAQGL